MSKLSFLFSSLVNFSFNPGGLKGFFASFPFSAFAFRSLIDFSLPFFVSSCFWVGQSIQEILHHSTKNTTTFFYFFFGCFSKYFLHIWVVWTTGSFWCNPVNILCRIFDITGLTMDTILSVYLKFLFSILLYYFVNTCRTITLCWFII